MGRQSDRLAEEKHSRGVALLCMYTMWCGVLIVAA